MDPITVGLLISAGVAAATSVGTSIANYVSQQKTNQKNEDLMREAWSRDDQSRTRMVSDLESAGLSKWLATGASPSGSSPVSLQTPILDNSGVGGITDALQHAYQNSQQSQMTKNQTALMQKQQEAYDASIAVSEAEKQIKEQELRVKTHDADVLESRGDTMSNDPPYLKYIAEAIKTFKGDSSRFPGFDDLGDKIKAYQEQKQKEKLKKRYEKYVEKKESVNEAKAKDKGENFKPMSYIDWLRMNQLPANSGTLQSYKSYAERR